MPAPHELNNVTQFPHAAHRRRMLDEPANDAARQSPEEGIAVADIGAWRDDLIQLLNDALATELVCMLRYKHHHVSARNIVSATMSEELLAYAQEEAVHAVRLARRVMQLGGEPDVSAASLAKRSHAEYHDAPDLRSMIRTDLMAARAAVERYGQMIELIGDRDPSTCGLVQDLLVEERQHARGLSRWIEDRP